MPRALFLAENRLRPYLLRKVFGDPMSSSTHSDYDMDDHGNAATPAELLLPATVREREEKVRKNFWKKFRRFAARIPFADDLVAAYYCALDPNTPSQVRAMLLGALAYFIMPVDFVPDFLLGFGLTDDAAILALVIAKVAEHIKPEHRLAAAKALDKGQPGGGDDRP
ncbi:hypothetical protein MnTg02_01987 [bacterium MnTg02]|nr:hypothetical protein MnTg02_01987 [bacterium MnTg02]